MTAVFPNEVARHVFKGSFYLRNLNVMGGGRSQGSGEIAGKPGGLGSTDRLRFGGNIRGKDEKPLLREDSVPFPASVSPCVEMKGHPLSRGLRWHQLPLNNLQVIPGGDGNHPGPADGRIRGLQMWGQELLWMWGCWHPCGWMGGHRALQKGGRGMGGFVHGRLCREGRQGICIWGDRGP